MQSVHSRFRLVQRQYFENTVQDAVGVAVYDPADSCLYWGVPYLGSHRYYFGLRR